MRYIKLPNQYPLMQGDIQIENKDWTDLLNPPEGWALVEEATMPELLTNQRRIENFPIFENGVWKQSWSVVEMSEEEIQKNKEKYEGLRQHLLDAGITRDLPEDK